MIGHDIDAVLPELRRQAESMLTLTLAAFSPVGMTQDADGYDVPAFAPEGSTFGKVQSRTGGLGASGDTAVRSVTIGGVPRFVLQGGLHIPVSAPIPEAGEQRGHGWEYVVTGVGPVDDPALLGMRFLVVSAPVKSRATTRRLDVVGITDLA